MSDTTQPNRHQKGRVSYLGVRHHGPGSARQVLQALDQLRPDVVLIEGPSDASDIMAMAVDPTAALPLCLLGYDQKDPAHASYWPFEEYSPEYQAIRWAVQTGTEVRFIDLSAAVGIQRQMDLKAEFLAAQEEEPDPETAPETDSDEVLDAAETADSEAEDETEPDAEAIAISEIIRDPLGYLSTLAGYEDPEGWWTDLIEENPDPGASFDAIALAMGELRARSESVELSDWEAKREAQMRLEIAAAEKATEGNIAVVCGAWHVPALMAKIALKDDRATVRGLKKAKIKLTWAPWTSRRMMQSTGYSAGIARPGWSLAVWRATEGQKLEQPEKLGSDQALAAAASPSTSIGPIATEGPAIPWLTQVSTALRDKGYAASTASVIEAIRTARTLAVIRDRPGAGYEELRDAAISVLCGGERIVWDRVIGPLLSDNRVGMVPSSAPSTPLIEDLQIQQKRAKLKPEALEREVSIDLRSDTGMAKSTLLKRLTVLGVPWGHELGAGASRGTFREKWMLRWEPEYSVTLIEQMVYGSTIEMAADNRLISQMAEEANLGQLADATLSANDAQLDQATKVGLELLTERAALTNDCPQLLDAIEPLIHLSRYGQARKVDQDALAELAQNVILAAAIALPFAAGGIDEDAAQALQVQIERAHNAVILAEFDDELDQRWRQGLRQIIDKSTAAPGVVGLSARLLFDAEALDSSELEATFSRLLSPAIDTRDAALFFEGFFDGASIRLVHDPLLRGLVNDWLVSLDAEIFVGTLPLLRRVLSGLDAMERRHILLALEKGSAPVQAARPLLAGADKAWPALWAHAQQLLSTRGAPQ